MKKKLNFKKVFGVGASAVMALSLVFGMCFSDFSSGTKTELDNPNSSENVEGGVLTAVKTIRWLPRLQAATR